MRRESLFLALFLGFALALGLGYAAINAVVDPFSHWRDEQRAWDGRISAYTLNRSLFKLVRLRRALDAPGGREQPINLIVGDSTTNQIDTALLERMTGERWINMSYGRATLVENVLLLEHLLGEVPLRRIVWGLPLTRFVGGAKNEIERSLWMAERPLAHLLTLESGRATFHVLREALTGEALEDPELPLSRELAERYLEQQLRAQLDSAPLPDPELGRIARIEREAQALGVPIVYVTMPVTARFRRFLEAVGGERRERWRAFLAGRCHLDLGLPQQAWPDALFRDSQHLLLEHVEMLTVRVAPRLEGGCTPADPGPARVSEAERFPGPR